MFRSKLLSLFLPGGPPLPPIKRSEAKTGVPNETETERGEAVTNLGCVVCVKTKAFEIDESESEREREGKCLGTRKGNSAGALRRVIEKASFDPTEQAYDRKSQVSSGRGVVFVAGRGWWNGFAQRVCLSFWSFLRSERMTMKEGEEGKMPNNEAIANIGIRRDGNAGGARRQISTREMRYE